MNRARRERKKKANRDKGHDVRPATVSATDIPHYTVTAGVASATGSVKPEAKD